MGWAISGHIIRRREFAVGWYDGNSNEGRFRLSHWLRQLKLKKRLAKGDDVAGMCHASAMSADVA